MRIPVIAIYYVGKIHKQLLLFNEKYRLVSEAGFQFAETRDGEGSACENLAMLSVWVKESFLQLLADPRYEVRAVNFSVYGAALIYLDAEGEILTPPHNYLNPFPAYLADQFYKSYGPADLIGKATASPALGDLNSGLQLYRLKYEEPERFDRLRHILYLPQFFCFLLSGELCSDITSIGCHTALWDFGRSNYHYWVAAEGLRSKFCALVPCTQVAGCSGGSILTGAGLYDCSAALIPYLELFHEPFVLISTGTCCISMNPFNREPLTTKEQDRDCFCYLSHRGNRVKASRSFAGYRHDEAVKKLGLRYSKPTGYHRTVIFDPYLLTGGTQSADDHYETAYHKLMAGIVAEQVTSTRLVLAAGKPGQCIFVDGVFSQNPVYMQLLAAAFPEMAVYGVSDPSVSALGAALAIHAQWNKCPIPPGIIRLNLVSPPPITSENHTSCNFSVN